jgi:hypothetical protein
LVAVGTERVVANDDEILPPLHRDWNLLFRLLFFLLLLLHALLQSRLQREMVFRWWWNPLLLSLFRINRPWLQREWISILIPILSILLIWNQSLLLRNPILYR